MEGNIQEYAEDSDQNPTSPSAFPTHSSESGNYSDRKRNRKNYDEHALDDIMTRSETLFYNIYIK